MDNKIIFLVSRNQEYAKVIVDRFAQGSGITSIISDETENLSESIAQKSINALLFDIPSISAGDALSALKKIRAFRSDNESIQQNMRELPVFVLADKGEHIKPLFEDEKISAYFEKPYDPAQLHGKVLEVLGLS